MVIRMSEVNTRINQLIDYALSRGLIEQSDVFFAGNTLIDLMREDACVREAAPQAPLHEVLDALTQSARERGLIGDSLTESDLFDTRLMGALTPRPSEVIARFDRIRQEEGVKAATDWFYDFSQDTNYIRRDRKEKDLKWLADTPYGDLEITINLAKPEKDPKMIALAGKTRSQSYPKCQLCRENEGYAGRLDHPARENHRILPVQVNGKNWFFQYSPYVYYNEHCIVFNEEHVPMVIDQSVFCKLLSFIDQFPHYFVGSNADLPIVGGSILSHEHFQGGRHHFPIETAPPLSAWRFKGYPEVKAEIVRWPMSVIRLRGADVDQIAGLSDEILTAWRAYSDPEAEILARTDAPHNTITPIARLRDGLYEMDLVLRNNRTSEEHPLGIFHPHEELHHIKKENIGLIEVMGLAVLPARLKDEITSLSDALKDGRDISEDEKLKKHADWIGQIREKYPNFDEADEILKDEIGLVFSRVLEDAGVFKQNEAGLQAFERFMTSMEAVRED